MSAPVDSGLLHRLARILRRAGNSPTTVENPKQDRDSAVENLPSGPRIAEPVDDALADDSAEAERSRMEETEPWGGDQDLRRALISERFGNPARERVGRTNL